MQPRNDVQSRKMRILHRILDDGDGVRRLHLVGALVLGVTSESAELAVRTAYIREVHMAVHVVVDDVATLFAPHMIGECAEPGDVLAVEEADAVLARQALFCQHLFFNIFIALGSEQILHFFPNRSIAAQKRPRKSGRAASARTLLTTPSAKSPGKEASAAAKLS